MGRFFQKFHRDILGVFWFALALFLALALFSFVPTDPSFNSIGRALKVHNYCGYFGSFLADLLYQGFGLASWLFVVAMVQKAARSFFNKAPAVACSWRLGWGALTLLTACSLVSLYLPSSKWFAGQILAGGLVGMVVSRALISVFNLVGVGIILWSLAVMLVIFYTERPLREILAWPFKALKYLPQLPVTALPKNVDALIAIPLPQAPQPTPTPAPERPAEAAFVFPLKTDVERPKEKRVKMATPVIENWRLPSVDLLHDQPTQRSRADEKEIQRKSELLVDKLQQFSVNGEILGIRPGPAVTMFEFKPKADVKISKITELADDLSLALSSESVRIIAPIPGRDVVGIETSNAKRETVYLKEILMSEKFWDEKIKLPLALGREANGDSKVVDLRKLPHLLVAGTTGSGKSVFIVSALMGLLFKHSPKSLRLILIDPKQVDLAAFHSAPHLLMPPIREAKKAVSALRWAIREMEKRYRSMSRFGARGIESFNEIVEKLSAAEREEHLKRNQEFEGQGAMKLEQYYFRPQPYIAIVVEEFGDLMAVDRVNVEQAVVRLAQMARACGMHLILAMQSPRKDVVTGLIKTNIPGRISFKVASKMDSRIILDEGGAERLLAQGDMLFLAPGVSKPQRHHGPWVSEEEIATVMKHWAHQGEPEFDAQAMHLLDGSGGGYDLSDDGEASGGDFLADESEHDDMHDEVLEYVTSMKEVSASLLQRRFRLGYPRAARLIELFEREGVVGPANGSKPRPVIRPGATPN